MGEMGPEIVTAALGGFCAWALMKCVGLAVMRRRLISYIVTVLNLHLRDMHDNQEWLAEMLKEHGIARGRVVEGAPYFTPNPLDDLDCVRPQCLQLLYRSELERLTKCRKYIWETEVLLGGLCRTLRSLQKARTKLDARTVAVLRLRAFRIEANVLKLPAAVKTLAELPIDYAGTLSAAAIVVPAKEAAAIPG